MNEDLITKRCYGCGTDFTGDGTPTIECCGDCAARAAEVFPVEVRNLTERPDGTIAATASEFAYIEHRPAS